MHDTLPQTCLCCKSQSSKFAKAALVMPQQDPKVFGSSKSQDMMPHRRRWVVENIRAWQGSCKYLERHQSNDRMWLGTCWNAYRQETRQGVWKSCQGYRHKIDVGLHSCLDLSDLHEWQCKDFKRKQRCVDWIYLHVKSRCWHATLSRVKLQTLDELMQQRHSVTAWFHMKFKKKFDMIATLFSTTYLTSPSIWKVQHLELLGPLLHDSCAVVVARTERV